MKDKEPMITKVFTSKGEKETIASAYTKLIDLNPNDKYKKKKAAGSLGGASRHGFLSREDHEYTRTR